MRHLSYANVMASVAVFVALGGGAYAAVQVNGKDIKNHTIAGKKVKNNTLGGKQINESTARRGADSAASTAQCRLGQGGVGDSADSATTAASATTADDRGARATNAANAANATNAANAATRTGSAAAPPAAFFVTARRPPRSTAASAGTTASRSAAGWIVASDTLRQRWRAPAHAERAGCLHRSAGHPARGQTPLDAATWSTVAGSAGRHDSGRDEPVLQRPISAFVLPLRLLPDQLAAVAAAGADHAPASCSRPLSFVPAR